MRGKELNGVSDYSFQLPKRTIIHETCAVEVSGGRFASLYATKKKIKAMLVLLFTRRSYARPRWREELAHRIWTPGIAGSTPVARRGFSVTKPVS